MSGTEVMKAEFMDVFFFRFEGMLDQDFTNANQNILIKKLKILYLICIFTYKVITISITIPRIIQKYPGSWE